MIQRIKTEIRFIAFLLVLSLFFSCINSEKSKENKIVEILNKKYAKAVIFFEDSLTRHFPEKLLNENSSFTYSFSSDMGNLELMLLEHLDKMSIVKKLKVIKNQANESYGANDSCLLIVNRFVNKNRHYKVKLTSDQLEMVDQDCYKGKYPVPNFWHNEYSTEHTACKLPSDFDIYVFESKAGKYHKAENLTEGEFMPIRWKNGFSRGVAVSKKRSVIIYWLIIW